MALLIGDNSTTRGQFGGYSKINDISEGTLAFWWKPTDNTTLFRTMFSKSTGDNGPVLYQDTTTQYISFDIQTGGTYLRIAPNSKLWTVNEWNFFAFTWKRSGVDGDQKGYWGDLDTTLAEFSGYSKQQVGTSYNTDALVPRIGNSNSYNNSRACAWAWFGIWDTYLNLAQLKAQYLDLRYPVAGTQSNVAMWVPIGLFDGASPNSAIEVSPNNTEAVNPKCYWLGTAPTWTPNPPIPFIPTYAFPQDEPVYILDDFVLDIASSSGSTYEESILLSYELQCAEPLGATEESIVGGLAKDLDLSLAYDLDLNSPVSLPSDKDLTLVSSRVREDAQPLEIQLLTQLDASGVIALALSLSETLNITLQDTIIAEEQTAISAISDLELSDQLTAANDLALEEDEAVDLASSATAEASQALEIDHDLTQTSQISTEHPIDLERDEQIGISDTLEAETALELQYSALLEQVDQLEIDTNIQLLEDNAVNLTDQIVVEASVSLSRDHDLALDDDISKEEYLSLEVDQDISLDTSATAESTLDLSLSQELVQVDQLDAQNALSLARDEEIALADQIIPGFIEESIVGGLTQDNAVALSDQIEIDHDVSLARDEELSLLSGAVIEESLSLGYELQCAEPLAPTYTDPITLEETHAIGIEDEVIYGGLLSLGKDLDLPLASDTTASAVLSVDRVESIDTVDQVDTVESVDLERTESITPFASYALYDQFTLEETHSLDLLDQLDALEEVTLDIDLQGTYDDTIIAGVSITLEQDEAIALLDAVGEYDESITLAADFSYTGADQVDLQNSVDFEQTLSLVLAPSAEVEYAVALAIEEEIALLDELESQTYEEAISLGANHAVSNATQIDAQTSLALELTEDVSYTASRITESVITLSQTEAIEVAYDLVVTASLDLERQELYSSLDVITIEQAVTLVNSQQYIADSQAVVPAILDIETLYNLPVAGSQVWSETLAISTNYGILYADEWLHLGQLPRDIIRLEVSIATTLDKEANLNSGLQLEAGINTQLDLESSVLTEVERDANIQTLLDWTLEI